MAYHFYRYFTPVTNGIVGKTGGQQQLLEITHSTNVTSIKGAEATGDDIRLYANTTDAYPYLDLKGNSGIDVYLPSGNKIRFSSAGSMNVLLDTNEIAFFLKETTTPTAVTNYGAIYTKNDNKLYFQDGAGTEHEVAFV